VNDELKRIWKEAVEEPSRHLLGETEETTKELGQGSRSPGRDLKKVRPEYEAVVLNTQPRRSVE
jgi:hypothetical protein